MLLTHAWITVLCAGPSKWVVESGLEGPGGRENCVTTVPCSMLSKAVIFMSDTEKIRSQKEMLELSFPRARCKKAAHYRVAKAVGLSAAQPIQSMQRHCASQGENCTKVKRDSGRCISQPVGCHSKGIWVASEILVRNLTIFLKEVRLSMDLSSVKIWVEMRERWLRKFVG